MSTVKLKKKEIIALDKVIGAMNKYQMQHFIGQHGDENEEEVQKLAEAAYRAWSKINDIAEELGEG